MKTLTSKHGEDIQEGDMGMQEADDDDKMDDDKAQEDNDSLRVRALRWAAKAFPFYLANADYTGELESYLRTHSVSLGRCTVYWDMDPFLEAVDQYLRVSILNFHSSRTHH